MQRLVVVAQQAEAIFWPNQQALMLSLFNEFSSRISSSRISNKVVEVLEVVAVAAVERQVIATTATLQVTGPKNALNYLRIAVEEVVAAAAEVVKLWCRTLSTASLTHLLATPSAQAMGVRSIERSQHQRKTMGGPTLAVQCDPVVAGEEEEETIVKYLLGAMYFLFNSMESLEVMEAEEVMVAVEVEEVMVVVEVEDVFKAMLVQRAARTGIFRLIVPSTQSQMTPMLSIILLRQLSNSKIDNSEEVEAGVKLEKREKKLTEEEMVVQAASLSESALFAIDRATRRINAQGDMVKKKVVFIDLQIIQDVDMYS